MGNRRRDGVDVISTILILAGAFRVQRGAVAIAAIGSQLRVSDTRVGIPFVPTGKLVQGILRADFLNRVKHRSSSLSLVIGTQVPCSRHNYTSWRIDYQGGVGGNRHFFCKYFSAI